MANEEIPVRKVTMWLCDLCLDGAGGECHTPGCAMWINRAPDIPLRDSAMVVVHDYGEYKALQDALSQPGLQHVGGVNVGSGPLEAWRHPDGSVSLDVPDPDILLSPETLAELLELLGRAAMPGQAPAAEAPMPEAAGLCVQRAESAAGLNVYVCTERLGHDDDGWHYDPLASEWWRRTADGVEHVKDPRDRTAARDA